jgi:lipopolysaccharide transport system ATP-binding protein
VSEPRVLFDGVSKKFRRGERHTSLREVVPALARRLMGVRARPAGDGDEFWALRDVSFEVRVGQALAIVGPNGGGKSTSLKLATRILRPDEGRVSVQGRTGALIELAAGFHPDLTGRENVFLQGAIMGMKRHDIQRRLDDIIAFAGVEEFVDTPVKRYSSGMNARLGFAIAAHLEPEVLIIDEVLSVGDMSFQQRCIERMLQFRRDGIPIVFVSHNLQAVSMLCDQAVLLQGRVMASGATEEVLGAYVRRSHAVPPSPERGGLRIEGAELMGASLAERAGVPPGTRLMLRVTYGAESPVKDVTLGFLVHRSTDMLVVHDANFTPAELGIGPVTSGETFTVDYEFRANLTRGHYLLDCHVFHNPTQTFLSRLTPAGSFSVHETRTWQGVADLDLRARLQEPSHVVRTGRS